MQHHYRASLIPLFFQSRTSGLEKELEPLEDQALKTKAEIESLSAQLEKMETSIARTAETIKKTKDKIFADISKKARCVPLFILKTNVLMNQLAHTESCQKCQEIESKNGFPVKIMHKLELIEREELLSAS